MIRFENILEKVESYNGDFDEVLLRKAYTYSAVAHKGQTRRSGEPYLIHPLNVAYILAEMQLDETSIAVGLLHDVIEDTLTTKESLREQFGEDVAEIVDGVTKISRYAYVSREEQQAETFRKMILAMASDLRVVLVKLADRLHNMRTLHHLPPERRKLIAGETREIYAPIANRLGMGRIKAELQDLCFQHLYPKEFADLRAAVRRREKISSDLVGSIRDRLAENLGAAGIEAEVLGRVKSISSIYEKLQRQGITFDQLHDYIAFRVITNDVLDCYAALGIVHQTWRPVPGKFKDYVAMPKPNFYQSLHTVLVWETGQPFEVQIRTRKMDQMAEQGIAAHWKYKEGRLDAGPDDSNFLWLRQLVEWQTEVTDPRVFMNSLKIDLYPDEVYTFSPRGDVFAFPRGATALDYAYRVHTDVGNHCVGARLNGKLVPLKTALRNGDIVEILTGTNQTPNREWLNLVVTSRARHKIRHWLNVEQNRKSVELGRRLVEKEARRYRLSLKKLAAESSLSPVLEQMGYERADALWADVGYGKVAARAVVDRLVPEESREKLTEDQGVIKQAVRRIFPFGSAKIKVRGQDDLMTYLAKCCNPLPGEGIIGYVTRGKGIAVHSVDCPNVKNLMFNPDRQIQVEWGDHQENRFNVDLEVVIEDRPGILARVINSISGQKTNIRAVDARTADGRGVIAVGLEINDLRQLERVIASLGRVDGVERVERKYRIRQVAG